MTKWHKGPPPSIGWWPAGVNRDPKMIRWWDGSCWSWPCWDGMTDGDMLWHATHTFKYRKTNIEWTDRPKSWPERSMT